MSAQILKVSLILFLFLLIPSKLGHYKLIPGKPASPAGRLGHYKLVKMDAVVRGQEPGFGVAQTYEFKNKEEIEDGDIISFGGSNQAGPAGESADGAEFMRTIKDYDEQMFGVVVLNPSLVIRSGENRLPVVKNGDVFVNVTTLNGPIKRGDYITSSTIPGRGQKATELTRYVLGLALEPFTEADGTKEVINGQELVVGQVMTNLSIGLATPSLVKSRLGFLSFFDELGVSLLYGAKASEGGGLFLRYLTAGLITLFAIIFGFTVFGRGLIKGIEAMGRNPLAKQSIQLMVIINAVLLLVVSIGAIVLSLVIIRL